MEKVADSKEGPKDANWEFHSEAEPTAQAEENVIIEETKPITWSASEYVAHHKNTAWFVAASLVAIAIACVVFLATNQSWFSAALVLIASATFIFFAAQPPRTLEYSLDGHALTIAGKAYDYHRFKSFSVIQEGAVNSISLEPLERFMPVISIYYEPKDEEKITSLLGKYLPYEERELAQVDKLMRKIRF